MRDYANACGKALALAHTRSARRSTSFEQSMTDTLAHQADTLISTGKAYAEQMDQDTRLLNGILTDRDWKESN